MAVKVLNNFIGPNGLVPTLLIFSTFLQILNSNIPALSIQQYTVAIYKVIEEITKERVKRIVNNTFNI